MKSRPVALFSILVSICAGRAPHGAETLVEVFRRVNPAVVEIHTKETDLPPRPEGQPVSVAGLGSGVLISPDGKVLTAAHVVQTADAIEVELLTGETLKARVLSSEPSADAAINQGNSGGPMFNMQGEVIGIVSHILSHSGGSEGLGFAVTSKVARELLEKKSFWSGVNGYMLSADLARVFSVPPPGIGLLVQRVAAGSPAERLGLGAGTTRATIGDEDLIVGGDIILDILGIPLSAPNSVATIRQKITDLKAGDPVTVTVLRGDKTITLTTNTPPAAGS
jgi:S1-C subfamily serine protease